MRKYLPAGAPGLGGGDFEYLKLGALNMSNFDPPRRHGLGRFKSADRNSTACSRMLELFNTVTVPQSR